MLEGVEIDRDRVGASAVAGPSTVTLDCFEESVRPVVRDLLRLLRLAGQCGFDLYDNRTAVVGAVGGAAYYNDPDDVARYVTMLAEPEQLAVFGDEVRELLAGLVAEIERAK